MANHYSLFTELQSKFSSVTHTKEVHQSATNPCWTQKEQKIQTQSAHCDYLVDSWLSWTVLALTVASKRISQRSTKEAHTEKDGQSGRQRNKTPEQKRCPDWKSVLNCQLFQARTLLQHRTCCSFTFQHSTVLFFFFFFTTTTTTTINWWSLMCTEFVCLAVRWKRSVWDVQMPLPPLQLFKLKCACLYHLSVWVPRKC